MDEKQRPKQVRMYSEPLLQRQHLFPKMLQL